MQVDVPGIQVIVADREATIQWPDFGPGRNYVVQLEQSDGTWASQDVDVVRATQPAEPGSPVEIPSKDVDRQATLEGLKNGKTYRARIVAASTLAEAEDATEPALVESGTARGGAAARAAVRAAQDSPVAVTTAPIVITPQAIPTPGLTQSVITVKVGGDRTGQTGVTPLAGVTLQLYNGGTGGPTTAVTDSWATCVSDAQGDCSFIVPNTNLPQPAGNQNRQFWIQRTGVPAGWFGINALRVGDIPTPNATSTYTFRTGTQLQGGATYTSQVNFMISTGNATNASGGIWQTSRANPTFPAQCGADVALILDLSGSVGQAGALDDLQAAARQFVSSLVGTPSRVALYTFASNAPVNGTNNQNRPLTAVSTAAGVTTVNNWINGTSVATGEGAATNWDRAFAQVASSPNTYDVAVVITDGDPTVYASPPQGPGSRTRFREVENGVFSANAIKAKGTRMIAFGVGGGVSGNAANLQSISGQTVNSDYYQTTDYAAAGNALRALALGSCSGSLSVIKMVIPPNGTTTDATPAGGWHFAASTTTSGVTLSPTNGDTASGTGAISFNLTFPGAVESAPVTAVETPQSGFTLEQVGGFNAVCTRLDTLASVPVTNAGSFGFTVTADINFPVSCRVYNRAPQPAATIEVAKQWIVNDVSYADGTQPAGLSATLRIENEDRVWGTVYGGYQQGQTLALAETTTIDRGQCTLTSSRLTQANGATVDAGLPYSALLGAGANTYRITNEVTCPTTLTLTKTVVNGTAAPTEWNLNAAAPVGTLPGPTGTSGSPSATDIPVTPDAVYVLSESGGDPAYVQEVGEGAIPRPGSTVSWFCSQVDSAGVIIPGFADGLNGGVQVPIGYRVVCNAVNATARLRLVKVVQGGSAVPSDWSLTATPVAPFPPGLTASTVTGTSDPVTAQVIAVRPDQPYQISESAVFGYHQVSVACVDAGRGAVTVPSDPLVPVLGSDIICTFTNARDTARLTLVKQVVNDNGGTATAGQWTLSAAGPTPITGTTGAAAVTNALVDTGTYTLSESAGPPGYQAGAWSCTGGIQSGTQVTLARDESVTCTIVNDDQPAHLTLVKQVNNTHGGAAAPTAWTLAAGGPTPISGVTGAAAVTNAPVAAGTYTLSESGGPAGYVQEGTWSCTGATVTDAQITLALNQSATCTIVNADQPAHLTLVKEVINDNGGTAVPTAWTLSAAGPTPITGTTGATAVTNAPVSAGTYTLSEADGPPGYTASSWVCVGGTQNGAQVTLALNQSATCTITNDDQAAHLTLVKTVTNDNGGTAAPTAWTLAADGPTDISGTTGSAAVTNAPVSAGAYALTESGGPAGYAAGAWACVGGTQSGAQVTLALGQSATCTINNDDQAAHLTLVKTVTNDQGGTAVPTAWILTATGPTSITGRVGDAMITNAAVNAGQYTLAESGGPAGYTASTWTCTAGTLAGDQLTLALGQSATCTINNNDQPARLTLRKIVDPAQSGTGRVPSEWTLTATPDGITGQGEVSGNGDPTSADGVFEEVVFAGDYTLSEDGPDGFTTQGWTCMGGVLAGTTVTVPSGGSVVCEIRNTAVAPKLTLVKVVDNGTTGATTAATAWTLSADGPTPISGGTGDPSVTGATVQVGTYPLDESGPPGYTRSAWVCTGSFESSAPGSATTPGSVTLLEGDDATCTITNTAIPSRLTLVKHVVNGPYGNAVPADWTLTAAGPQTVTGPGNSAAVTNQQVSVGAYALSESDRPGFTASSWTCTGATPVVGSNVTIGLGQDVTCEITNTRNSANITLEKRWVNAHAGDTAHLVIDGTADDDATSIAPAAPDADNSVTVRAFAGETVNLSETLAGAGVYETELTCDQPELTWDESDALTGTYRAPLGTLTDVTCTFTNTGQTHQVTLQKIWVDAYAGDTAELSVSGGLPGAQNATSTATGAVGPETDTAHAATAEVLIGATATLAEVLGADNVGSYDSPPAIACTAGEQAVAVTGASFTMPGMDVNCTITNERAVTPPGRPDVSAVTCTIGDPPALVAGTITIPENSEYAFTINGVAYGPGTYTFDAGTYHVTATLIRGTPVAASGIVRPLAQDTYEWDVTIVAPSVCPGLAKTADPPNGSDVDPGDIITYTITVQNVGVEPVDDETIVDTLPDGVELIESSVDPAADFDAAAGTLTWTINMPAGSDGDPSELQLTYQVEVTADEGTLVNTARWVERNLTVQTVHYVTPPPGGPPELPHTGASDVVDTALAGVLLLGGGALVTLGVRRRRREE